MASPLHPLLGGVLLSFGSIEGIGEEPLSAPERKATPERNLERACLQRPLKGKCGYFSLVCLLNVAFVSLVVVYFLVRCFDVTRERHRVGRLTRSLAAGGDSPCRGDGDEEDGEGSENEDAGIGNFEKPAFQQQAEGASVGSLVGQTQDTPRRPSLLTVAIPWGLRGNNGFANGREHATTSAVEGGYAQVLGNLNYSGGRMGRLQNPESQGPPQPGPGRRGAGNDENDQVNVEVRLLEGETLEMWEGRNLPPYAETRLLSVFKRMMEAASACRSVLGVVSERQRLQLSCEVMRLLGLELGALSLVRQHLEPLRSDLGCAVLQLGFDALKHTASLPTIETHCEPVRNLIALIIELKQPRPPTEENVALRYRKKMVSVLQTATTVVGYCLGVLEGLLKLKDGESLVVPSIVVEQQIGVIKALYDVHSAQIAMDASLRYFIVTCQKRIGAYPILGPSHLIISSYHLPPLRQMVDKIHEAVRNSGGLLQAPATPYTKQYTSQPHTPQRTRSPNEVLSEPAQQFTPAPQLYLAPPGVTTFQSVQLAATSTHLSHPRFPPPHVRYYASQLHQAQPPPSPYSRRHFGSSVSRSHHQQQAVPSIPSQATTRTTVLEQHQLVMPTHGSGRGDVSATVLPYSAVGQEAGPLPQPYSQQPRPILVGPYAHAGAPRYPSQSAYSMSEHGDRPHLRQPATRRTEQASVGMSSWGYRTLEGDIPQQEEEEEVEEVEGLLGELIKGGLKLEDIFPSRKRSDA